MSNVAVFCCDVGSVRAQAFGWARAGGAEVIGNNDIEDCLEQVVDDLKARRNVALGLESPLFVPVPGTANGLSRGRDGEGNRSCFAPAGGYVTTLGLHELAYLLQGLAGTPVTLDWTTWQTGPEHALLIWEAFVSGPAHTASDDHVADAATGAVEFLDRLKRSNLHTDVTVEQPRRSLSIAGMALLWAGLAEEVAVLHTQTLVIKPTKPHSVVVKPPTKF